MDDTTSAAQIQRELFEEHMRTLNPCVRLARQSEAVGGRYRTMTVQRAWELWQAARRAQQPVAREPLPSAEIMRIVMDVEQQHHYLRGTTNWAVSVGRAIEHAHGITGGNA